MLLKQLQQITKEGEKNNLSANIIKIQLKEFLILHTLNFIYNSPKWNSLIFTGGTALRLLKKTGRLSEDLDLDYLTKNFKYKIFSEELLNYFKQLGIENLQCSLKSNGKIIVVKFPILFFLKLTNNAKQETDLLHLKIEIEKNNYPSYNIEVAPIATENLFFVVRHYDFPTLFSNKIGAILGRKGKIFHDKYDFRGRDFYDLIWFLKSGYLPNFERIKEILKAEQDIEIKSNNDIWKLLTERIKSIDTRGIYDDLKNLIPADESTKQLSQNYLAIFEKLVEEVESD
jgi:predicted nucleotidyltransferase component of viral defense system